MLDIFVWHHLIFYISILLGMVLVLTSTLGLHASGHGHGDSFRVAVQSHVHVHASIHTHASIHHDHQHDHYTQTTQTSILQKVLSLFGIGECPINIIFLSWLLVFGGVGVFVINFVTPTIAILISAFCAIFLTRFLANGIARMMPNFETYTATPDNLIGNVGVVVVSVDQSFGQVHVHDQFGNLQKVIAMTNTNTLPIGTKVLVLEYKEKENAYVVQEYKEETSELV